MAVVLLLLWNTEPLRRVSTVLLLVAVTVDGGTAVTKVEVDVVIVVIFGAVPLVHLRVLVILIIVSSV